MLVPTEYHSYVPVTNTRRWQMACKRRVSGATLVASDVLFAFLVWWVANGLQEIWGQGALTAVFLATMAPIAGVWVSIRALLGLSPGYGLDSVEWLRRHTYSVFAALAMVAIFDTAVQMGDKLSRLLLGLVFLGLLILAPLARYLTQWELKRIGWWGKPVVVLSSGEAGANVVNLLKERWELGYEPIAALDYQLDTARTEPVGDMNGQRIWAGILDLARKHSVDTAIFAMPHTRREQLAEMVSLARLNFRHVMVVPNLGQEHRRNLGRGDKVQPPQSLGAADEAGGGSHSHGGRGILVLPKFLVLGLLIYLESGWPVFYADRRMGKDGRPFSCVKFRTMVSDAEALLQTMLEENVEFREEYSKYRKLRDDPRITRVGRFLRKTSLDELPQLWNVIRGEMSLVDPRPYLPRESQDIWVTQSEILRVPPGITSPWQVSGRNRRFFSERVEIDAYYVRDWSVWLDILLLARTAKALLFDQSAYWPWFDCATARSAKCHKRVVASVIYLPVEYQCTVRLTATVSGIRAVTAPL
jgi:lipopolysaccharide/colanic/teichoic acid biosynthesis glycosyltransferase